MSYTVLLLLLPLALFFIGFFIHWYFTTPKEKRMPIIKEKLGSFLCVVLVVLAYNILLGLLIWVPLYLSFHQLYQHIILLHVLHALYSLVVARFSGALYNRMMRRYPYHAQSSTYSWCFWLILFSAFSKTHISASNFTSSSAFYTFVAGFGNILSCITAWRSFRKYQFDEPDSEPDAE